MVTRVSSKKAVEYFLQLSPRRFKFLAFIQLPFCILFCVFCTWMGYKKNDIGIVFVGIIGGLIFIFLYFVFMNLKNTKFEIHSDRIVLNKGKGSSVFLPWRELSTVREVVTGAGLLLIGASSKSKIIVPLQTENYDVARERIFAEWDKIRPPLTLPATYRAFPMRSITLDSKGITVHRIFRTTVLTWRQVKLIQWGFNYFLDPRVRFSFLRIEAENGLALKLRGWRGRLPEIYLVLRRVWHRSRRMSLKQEKDPLQITEGRLFKNIWLAVLGGALWAVAPGLFLGKFLMGKLVWLFFTILIILLFGIPIWAFKRESLVLRTAAPRKEIHPFRTAVLILCSFCFGFLFCRYFFSYVGEWELRKVKSEIAEAGFKMGIPANDPRVPDQDNAVYYLRKANELPSSASLIYKRDKREKAYDEPFYGKKTQQNVLDQIMKDLETGVWSQEERALARRLLAAHQDGIRLIENASQAKGIDWGIDYSVRPAYNIEVPRMVVLNWTRLFICKAYLEAGRGDEKAALKSMRTCFFLGDVSRRVRFIIGDMIATACYKIMLVRAPSILSKMDPAQLKKEFLPSLDVKGLVDAFKACEEFEHFTLKSWRENFNWGIYKPFIAHDLAVCYVYQLRKLKDLELVYSKQKAAIDKENADFQNKSWFFGSISYSNEFGMHSKLLESVAYCHMAAMSVEARLYHKKKHRWPEKVEQLPAKAANDYSDPFSDGDNLKIVPKGSGIQITSLGPDEWDSQGSHLGRRPLAWFVKK